MQDPQTSHLFARIIGNKQSGVVWGLIALAVLGGANLLAFYEHYEGRLTFPWDFIGGYHAQAFAWYADGSFFNPPKWFAWGDLGFPGYWSLQSGAFYFPLVLLDVLNQPYTVYVATFLQALHVLAGSIGLYLLMRTLRFEPLLALLGALAFHFSASFYSNAQHVDIVRATALLPWLMWCVHPDNLLRSRARPVVAALILFQFLIAAYPGAIVSVAYTLIVFVGAYLLRQSHQRRAYLLLALALVGASATAMSMVKWLAPFMEGDLITTGGGVRMALEPPLVLTFALPYAKPFLPNDLTMRSLWLPVGFLMGLAFLSRLSYAAKVSLILVAMAIGFAGVTPMVFAKPLPLPGFGLSRFPLADWRPIMHIGLIVLACEGWRNATTRLDPKFVVFRSLLAGAGFLILAWFAVAQGYGPADILRAARIVSITLVLTLALTATATLIRAARLRLSSLILIGLAVLATVDAYGFHRREDIPWRIAWNPAVERQLFGGMVTQEGAADREELALERRPERLVIGDGYEAAVTLKNSEAYNKCFYASLHCVLGYTNLRLSEPHLRYRQIITDPVQGPKLLAFVRQPQKLLVLPREADLALGEIPLQPNDAEIESFVSGVEGRVTGYGGSWARYKLSSPHEVRVVENEIWTHGWSVRFCRNGDCLPPREPEHTAEYLRTWTVPAGTWDIELDFQVRSERYAWLLFFFGACLMLAAGSSIPQFLRRPEPAELSGPR